MGDLNFQSCLRPHWWVFHLSHTVRSERIHLYHWSNPIVHTESHCRVPSTPTGGDKSSKHRPIRSLKECWNCRLLAPKTVNLKGLQCMSMCDMKVIKHKKNSLSGIKAQKPDAKRSFLKTTFLKELSSDLTISLHFEQSGLLTWKKSRSWI